MEKNRVSQATWLLQAWTCDERGDQCAPPQDQRLTRQKCAHHETRCWLHHGCAANSSTSTNNSPRSSRCHRPWRWVMTSWSPESDIGSCFTSISWKWRTKTTHNRLSLAVFSKLKEHLGKKVPSLPLDSHQSDHPRGLRKPWAAHLLPNERPQFIWLHVCVGCGQ